MFEHRKIVEGYESSRTIRRLIWLSKLLKKNAQTVFHIEQLQPQALSRAYLRNFYVACVTAIIWLGIGIPVGSACGLIVNLVTNSAILGVIAGLLYGLTGGLGMWIAITSG
jgi:hypothetical protein